MCDVRAVAMPEGIRLDLLTEVTMDWFRENTVLTVRPPHLYPGEEMLGWVILEPETAAELVALAEAAGLTFEDWFPDINGEK